MQLKCGARGTALHGSDVDVDALRASCRQCGWQLGGTSQGAYRRPQPVEIEDGPTEELPPKSLLPPLPHFISVLETSEPGATRPRLTIEIRNSRTWRLPFLMLVLTFYIGIAILTGVSPRLMIPLFFLLTWVFGALFANTRTLTVEADVIIVTYKPFPLPEKRIRLADLKQLWVDEIEEYRGDITYRLRAKMRVGGDITLVRQLDDPLAALHLERRIEELLGIIDRPVPGELSQ